MIARVRRWVRWRMLRSGVGALARERGAYEVMPEAELRAALAVEVRDPRFRAFVQILHQMEGEARDQVSASTLLTHENAALALAHGAGGMEWLRSARLYLESIREASMRSVEERKS